MLTCSRCGQENPDGARFCNSCASPLAVDVETRLEERKVVTVLFADLVGFTSRAERMDPEEVRGLLRPYHARLRDELECFGGTVEKFIGDAAMAVFGAPVAHEDDAERAVRAALAIRDWILEEQVELQLRTGVKEARNLGNVMATRSQAENKHVLGRGEAALFLPPMSESAQASPMSYDHRDIDGRSVMFGRLVEIEGVDPSGRQEAEGIIREKIIPGMKEIDGFAGFIFLVDEENHRSRSVVLWETKEGADEAESKFGPIRNEIVSGMGGTVRSADLFEAALVEVLAGVHA